MEDVLDIVKQQALEYFDANDYRVISSEMRPRGLRFLAKNLKTGDNETFVASRMRLEKFVHTNYKREPWIWKEVAEINCPKKSKLEEMKQAIKKA